MSPCRLRLVAAVITACTNLALADHLILGGTGDVRNWGLACSGSPDSCLAVFSLSGYSVVQRINHAGQPLDSPVYPWGSATVIHQTAIAYNSHADEYLLISYDNGGLPWPPYTTPRNPSFIAVRLNRFGTPLTGPYPVVYGARFGTDEAPCVRITYNSLANEYLLTMQRSVTGGGDIFAQRISATGTPLGALINITNAPTSSFNSHAVAYAPIVSPETPTGRYLLVWDWAETGMVYMLDSYGEPLWVFYHNGHPVDRSIPFDWGSPVGDVYHPDVAYGEIPESSGATKVFLVVWADYNNHDPYQHYGTEWTGIWGAPVDAERLVYTSPLRVNSPFPISAICQHWSEPAMHPWLPQVAFNWDTQRFFVAWRETSADHPCNDTRQTHIRATYVDYLYRYPPHKNMIISTATGAYPGVEQPLHPAIASIPGGALITWDDNRNAGAGDARDLYGQTYVPPPSDACANAVPLAPGWALGSLVHATTDGSCSCGGVGGPNTEPDVWGFYTAPADGAVRVRTCGTNDWGAIDAGMDTVLSVHSGCPGSINNELPGACNDDWPYGSAPTACNGPWPFLDAGASRDSALTVPVTTGQTIWIRLSKFPASAAGVFYFLLGFIVPPDFDQDEDVDADDLAALEACALGPEVLVTPDCQLKDLDHDGDVDQDDFGTFQRCYSGSGIQPEPTCAN
ncbi:MAG: hypothetical protein WBL15_07295 [Phycisphaerae bacterium]